MSGTFKVKFYSDPGHGWGAVKRKVLTDLGIAHKITPYSYQKGDTVYLEEDCDLSELVTTLATKGIVIQYEEHTTNRRSPIRGYDRFVA
jgi:hypothetical protein